MRHQLQADGFCIKLRPVRMDDAAFIVWLRNLDHTKGKIGDSAKDVTSQLEWLSKYFEREGDYYFIVETPGGIPIGTHGLYDVSGTSAEAGRFVMRPEVPAAVATSVLTFDLAFGSMNLTELRTSSVSTNRSLHSYIQKMGFRQVRVESAAQTIGGQPVDILHFVMTAGDWSRRRERFVPLAELATTQIREWELERLSRRLPS
jgi:RimJ/RimL family protein N-acetyltransferase